MGEMIEQTVALIIPSCVIRPCLKGFFNSDDDSPSALDLPSALSDWAARFGISLVTLSAQGDQI